MLGRIVFAVVTTAAGWAQQPLLDQGEAAMRAKQYPQALALLQQALAANPDDATANLLAAGAAVERIHPEPSATASTRGLSTQTTGASTPHW